MTATSSVFSELVAQAAAERVQAQRSGARHPAAPAAREGGRAFDLHLGLLEGGTPARARRGLTLPISMGVHAAGVAALLVVPLFMAERLPDPTSSGLRVFLTEPTLLAAPPPPPPPPAPGVATRAKAAPSAPARTETPTFTVPTVVPTDVTPEAGLDTGIEGGVPGGVEGGVPGGVVGGVIGGLPEAPPPVVAPPIRVGGHIREPRRIKGVAPVYPDVALAARVEGIVIIEAVIGADGRVADAKVLRPVPLLDEAALAAVRQWVYAPTLLDGVPRAVVMTVTVDFHLKRV